MRNIFFLLAALLFLPAGGFAQQLTLSPGFLEKMQAMGLEFNYPTDSDYRDAHLLPNPYQLYDYALQSRKENLEVRLALQVFRDDDPATQVPNLQATRAATSVATNVQDVVMTVLTLNEKTLNRYNADWGLSYFFVPKPGFSGRKHCKMLALYKEGRGTVLLFLLFDDPGNEAIEWREDSFRFATHPPK